MESLKIFDKSDSEMKKLESSKEYAEAVAIGGEILLKYDAETGDKIHAVVLSDCVLAYKNDVENDEHYFSNVYEVLVKFPIISQYQKPLGS